MQMSCKYGSVEWLEQEYQLSENDPWGLSWRGFERCRYEQTLKVLDDAIIKLRKPRAEVKMLDVGCSSGTFTHLLRDLAGSVTGIDLSETAIQRARASYGNIIFQVGSVSDSGLGLGAYDAIVCMEVIYYVSPAEQDAFLAAVDRLLVENGVVVITSKVGDAPYFSEKGLVHLVTRQFKLADIFRYGFVPVAKGEGFLFGLWKRAHKLRRFLENDGPNKPSGFHERMSVSPRRQAALQKLQSATGKSRFLRLVFRGIARVTVVSTEMCLKWKGPSLAANWLARKLNLHPTHIILLLTKQHRASLSVITSPQGVD
jgi:2-polyprenyl-3-methyl-5-hydroxy-6-metoxy-1,4-benzoquinol methylase